MLGDDDDDIDGSFGEEDEFCLLSDPPLTSVDTTEGTSSSSNDCLSPKRAQTTSSKRDDDEAHVMAQLQQDTTELSLVVEGKLVQYRELASRHFILAQARYKQGSTRAGVMVALRNHGSAEQGVAYWEGLQTQLRDFTKAWETKLHKARRKSLPATMGVDGDGKSQAALAQLCDIILTAADLIPLEEEIEGDLPKRMTNEELWERLEASLEQEENKECQ